MEFTASDIPHILDFVLYEFSDCFLRFPGSTQQIAAWTKDVKKVYEDEV